MKKKGGTTRYTAEQIDAMLARGESRTDWARVKRMTEEELEASIAPTGHARGLKAHDPDDVHATLDWNKAVKGLPPAKRDIHLRIDADVLDWFKQAGRDYQTRINEVFARLRREPADGRLARALRRALLLPRGRQRFQCLDHARRVGAALPISDERIGVQRNPAKHGLESPGDNRPEITRRVGRTPTTAVSAMLNWLPCVMLTLTRTSCRASPRGEIHTDIGSPVVSG
jgi:uncharacterized protein (DUF4415 family)